MSDAQEEKKAAPTTEEQAEKLDAMLKEQQEALETDLKEAQEEDDLQVTADEADEKAAVEGQEGQPQSREEAKVSLMELGIGELREIAAGIPVKIPFDVRSKDAISDLLIAFYYDEVAPEAPEAVVATAMPEVVKTAPPAVSAEIHRLLDEHEGHAPTVRGFMDLSLQIKTLLPLE